MSLGKRIQEARKKCNITQEELAEKLGVTRQSISRWESDVVYPDMENIVKLANELDVSCDYLLKNEIKEAVKENPFSRLLLDIIGKKVSVEFYDDDETYTDLFNVELVSVEDGIVKIQDNKKNESIFVKLSLIKAFKVEE